MLRHVKHHQVAAELEVTPFGANLRTHQHLAAILFIGKRGGGPVALYQ